jgi:hypothetical protein
MPATVLGENAVTLPTGNTAARPSPPSTGQIRFNTETASVENYDGSNWKGLGGASGAGGNQVFYENDQTVTTNYTITTSKNAMTAGPITINSGVSVTVPSGSVWTIV